MTETARQKLAQVGIQLAAETETHFLFTRDQCLALVWRRGESFGSAGSTGILTEHGLAYLVWRDDRAFLKSKAAETPADEAQIVAVRRFSRDLESALR